MTYTVEKLMDGKWVKDRTYKVFANAEKRLYDLYKDGVNARMMERKGKG